MNKEQKLAMAFLGFRRNTMRGYLCRLCANVEGFLIRAAWYKQEERIPDHFTIIECLCDTHALELLGEDHAEAR